MNKVNQQKNIQIPVTLFKDIVEFMEYLDESNWICERDILFRDMYSSIMNQIQTKQDSMALRKNYEAIIYAKDECARHDSRNHYLRMKRILKP